MPRSWCSVALVLLVIAFGCDAGIMGRSVEVSPSALVETVDNINSRLTNPLIPSIFRRVSIQGVGNNNEAAPAAEEPRLVPLPIDIEQIKKIATLLIAIGSQIIPALLDPSSGSHPQVTIETS